MCFSNKLTEDCGAYEAVVIIPSRFLVRLAHPCLYVAGVPDQSDDAVHLVDLPDAARIENFAAMDGQANFADVRIAWNDFGLAVQATVTGKSDPPAGDAARPWSSDGLMFWIDTRDARTSHRASRYCHQFHFLPAGAGDDKDEPAVVPMKINRALQDAPLANASEIPFRVSKVRGGYRLEVFLPAAALNGFDPQEHPRLGFYYVVRDRELGDQFLSVNGDFPFADDPSLWSVLELVK
jgi:hypothetical protein